MSTNDINCDLPDGIETEQVDLNGDGYEESIISQQDSDYNGIIDHVVIQSDLNCDYKIDSIVKIDDYDQNGISDAIKVNADTDGDGEYDFLSKLQDRNGDGILDYEKTTYDMNQDTRPDMIVEREFIDSNNDGQIDTLVIRVDSDADGSFEEIYKEEVDSFSFDDSSLNDIFSEELRQYMGGVQNFNPATANAEAIVGTPAEAMKNWEFQGDTNRCALYAQKSVLEQITGRDIDIEEIVDIAKENGWFPEERGTGALNIDKVLQHYGVESEMSFFNKIEDIEASLARGEKVLVSLDADEIWYSRDENIFSPLDGANHVVEVIGIDRSDPEHPMVILNDSGTRNGCGEMVPLDTFQGAWDDGNCQMVRCA